MDLRRPGDWMSATRQPIRPGARDFFETSLWAARAVIADYAGAEPKVVLDPGCGSGNLTAACLEGWPRVWCMGVDLDDGLLAGYAARFSHTFHVAHLHADYLAADGFKYDLAICNPPFSAAQEFVTKLRSDAPEAAVAVLLRLAFLESKKRVEWWQQVGVPSLRILVPRPSFNAQGTSDSSAYAWFCWNWSGPPLCWLSRDLQDQKPWQGMLL